MALEVLFRADASRLMGTGHVMRCLTLADALVRKGWHCGFVCREQDGDMADWIRARGHDLWLLPPFGTGGASDSDYDGPPHAAWLGVPWLQDAEETRAIAAEVAPRWLVVDHYALDARWERVLAPEVGSLMVIDDLADRDHDCQLLLDQNPGRVPEHYSAWVPGACVTLTGTRYALLRDEFRQWRERRPPVSRTARVGRILVTLGGSDPDNVTGKVLSALGDCQLPADTQVDVVMGPSASCLAAVHEQVRALPFKATVTVGATNMAERMALSDLAIGAAGATSWERCCLGLPSLVVAIADNQRGVLQTMTEQGLAEVADLPDLAQAVKSFVDSMQADPGRYFRMVERASVAVDGLGAARVAERMMAEHREAERASGFD